MKAIVVIGDGMPDLPDDRGKTPLEEAYHPNMDEIASRGIVGAVDPIPDGMYPGSDVAILGLMGYDPKRYYTGRGPLEAAGTGVELREGDLAFRCNLITVDQGLLIDYSAGHISDEEAKELVAYLNSSLLTDGYARLYVGVSYRHTLILRGGFSDHIKCTPPHEAVGKRIEDILAAPLSKDGEHTAKYLNKLILKSYELLAEHELNLKRVKRGLKPANMMWPWGFGRKPSLPSFKTLHGLSSAVISAVSLVKGIGVLAEMKLLEVPGATGYLDTNYEGKADYALRALEEGVDVVFIHVEAPDEAGHQGSFELKVKAIEDLDKRLLGRLLDRVGEDVLIALLSDHLTPVSLRVHVKGPVPFAAAKAKWVKKGEKRFHEGLVNGLSPLDGPSLLKLLLNLRAS
ncbi:MAG: cofactor-independent phosphoglycerate mutase [Thermoprotei archaeon]|nr:MAG: cofactor-independent phosphoglycerate mutase [Thermoprotei archaeon]